MAELIRKLAEKHQKLAGLFLKGAEINPQLAELSLKGAELSLALVLRKPIFHQ